MALMLVVASRDFDAWVDRLPWLLAVLFCANVVSATQDIATDGYAITQLRPEWRGLGNSIQVVGYKLGMVMGSGGLLWLVARHGWQASYGSLACLMLLVIVPVLFMDDARTPAASSRRRTPSGTACAVMPGVPRLRRATRTRLVAADHRAVQVRRLARLAHDGTAADRQRAFRSRKSA